MGINSRVHSDVTSFEHSIRTPEDISFILVLKENFYERVTMDLILLRYPVLRNSRVIFTLYFIRLKKTSL